MLPQNSYFRKLDSAGHYTSSDPAFTSFTVTNNQMEIAIK